MKSSRYPVSFFRFEARLIRPLMLLTLWIFAALLTNTDWLCASFYVRAEKLPLKKYTTADGLGHDHIDEIVRDSRGFLWFCTGEGLARFDGYEFKNFTQADGLPHRRVMDLIETRDGKYLIATYAGIAVFNPLGTSRRWNDIASAQEAPKNPHEPPMFRVLRPPDAKQDKRAWTVMDLLEDREGRIWAATLDGLYQLEAAGEDWIFHRLELEAWRGKGLEFRALLEDHHQGLWIGSPGLVFRLLPDGKVEVIQEKSGSFGFLEDRQGRVWSQGGEEGKGVSLYTFPNGQNKPVLTHTYTTRDGLTGNVWINDLLETSDGRILVGNADAVCEFLPQAKEGEPKFRVILQCDVISLAEDSGGNIWVGTNENGASKLARQGFTLFDEADFPKFASFSFSSIFAGAGNGILVSAGTTQLLHFDGKQFISVKPAGMKYRSWGWNQIDFQSRTGEWWIGGGDRVLRYANVRFEDLAHTKPLATYSYPLPGRHHLYIFRLFEDSRGDVWIGLGGNAEDTLGISLLRWERATNKLHTYSPREYNLPYGNGPTAFAEDRDGNIWIGLYFDGLVRYRNGSFQIFTNADGMPSGIVNAIYNDSAGRIWIATGSNGVIRIDNPTDEKPRLVNLTVAEGLSSNQAACLTEDNFGRIYVGTGRGVTRIEPTTGQIKIYSQADGLPHSYVRLCGRDGAGRLWFAQQTMLARLVPGDAKTTTPPPLFIGGVRVNGETARKLSELGETQVSGLEFASDQRQIQIDFFALGFSTGETLRYQYKLDTAEWSALTAQRSVNLNLSPGTYQFLMRAVNAEGIASPTPASVSFSIARPLWQRWWFLLLAVLGFGSALYAAYRYRIARLIELERVRTRIATDLHDDIGSNLSLIAMASEVAQQQASWVNQPVLDSLTLVARVSRQSVDAMSDIVWAVNPKRDHLHDLAERMQRFASDTFSTCDIEFQFQAPDEKSDARLGTETRREVYLIFKECVNNIAKHSECCEAEINLSLARGVLRLTIRDNGKGFEQTHIENGYGGNGLQSIQQRAESLGGTLEIASQQGAGTHIKLEVPMRHKH